MHSLAQRMVKRVKDGDRRLDVVEYVGAVWLLNIDPQTGFELLLCQIAKQKQKLFLYLLHSF